MLGTLFFQHVHHVFEIFIVPALVGRTGDRVRIFLQCCAHDFPHRTVMAQVNDFRTMLQQQAANQVDRGIVSVKQ